MTLWNPDTTKNFTRAEMACKCGKCGGECEMRQDFMDTLQALRTAYGKPLTVTSGYRCSLHPAEAKKASPGTHAQGRAADIACTDGATRYELQRRGFELGFTGVGVAKTFLHFDNRTNQPVSWTY